MSVKLACVDKDTYLVGFCLLVHILIAVRNLSVYRHLALSEVFVLYINDILKYSYIFISVI